jgi:antitoxin CptB
MNPQTRLRWQCRRGMLELDLLLQPFLEKNFPALSEQEKILFERLLSCGDQDLYDWLVRREPPADQELVAIIHYVQQGTTYK